MNKNDEFNAADALIGLATTQSNPSVTKKAHHHDDSGLTIDNGGKSVKFPVKVSILVFLMTLFHLSLSGQLNLTATIILCP